MTTATPRSCDCNPTTFSYCRIGYELVVLFERSQRLANQYSDLVPYNNAVAALVGHWGMSDAIGPVAFSQGEEHPFLGKEIHEQRKFSEETAHVIDQEVQRFLINAAERAASVLRAHREQLDRIADALLERESLGPQDLTELLGEPVTAGSDGQEVG